MNRPALPCHDRAMIVPCLSRFVSLAFTTIHFLIQYPYQLNEPCNPVLHEKKLCRYNYNSWTTITYIKYENNDIEINGSSLRVVAPSSVSIAHWVGSWTTTVTLVVVLFWALSLSFEPLALSSWIWALSFEIWVSSFEFCTLSFVLNRITN